MSTARTTSTGPVRYERRGPVAVVTMDRPEYRNAQNSAMTYALDRAFYRAAEDGEVKVVVVAGAGRRRSRCRGCGGAPRCGRRRA
ncbi:enoyl-CoA hydratase-related protein, partial [Streptomyces roseolus]|uniref:enoyl-CoA hydratase-related protein n=1 Tax=Streptomyces roseolus TaxID=67358 RepID=UPI0036503215